MFDLVKPDLQNRVEKEQERQKINHDKKVVEREFDMGENSYAKNFRPGDTETRLPAVIIERHGPRNFTVSLIQENVVWRRHADHLLPRHVLDSPKSSTTERSCGIGIPIRNHQSSQ